MAAGEELIEIVGAENVTNNSETLTAYSSDNSFVPPVRPAYVVKPEKADEVQAIVRWANQALRPLVPVSSGPPHFRGDTVPVIGGSIIVDLSRMKRVVRVDRRNRVAMVESGVTFDELIPELEREGLGVYLPLAPRRGKSVVGSMLEREPITAPRYHWDSQDPLLTAEVIFGSGDEFLLVISGMSIGVMNGRKAISGSCGGLSAGGCELCSGNCRKKRDKAGGNPDGESV